ncbi:MAG: hypothetical protein FWE34_04010 [Defluviitaleaceae bacterium]|nr:hypothetical protein [Defluviitaleaceae bacterium]
MLPSEVVYNVGKDEIFRRDNFKCVMCGKGTVDGVEVVIQNGQTLCDVHAVMIKGLEPAEIGKKMFLRFYEYAKEFDDKDLLKLSTQALEFYEENGINGHIVWER